MTILAILSLTFSNFLCVFCFVFLSVHSFAGNFLASLPGFPPTDTDICEANVLYHIFFFSLQFISSCSSTTTTRTTTIHEIIDYNTRKEKLLVFFMLTQLLIFDMEGKKTPRALYIGITMHNNTEV